MTEEKRRGQSLIEAMVALTIIMTSVVSALALVQASITASRVGGGQVVAANLAREGIEVVRALRDSDWLAGQSFQQGLTNASVKTARPFLDLTSGSWSLVFPAATLTLNDPLTTLYLTREGAYVQADSAPAGASASPYRRLLTLNYVCRNIATGAERIETGASTACNGVTETLVGLDVVSDVRWPGASGAPRVTTAEERLYDWR